MEYGTEKFEKWIRSIINDDNNKHECYQENVRKEKDMSVHFYGTNPKEILERYRPNEQKDIQKYRLSIWKPVTKSLGDKVINTVNKIVNPRFFSLKFPEFPRDIVEEEEKLPNYLLENYPVYGSVWNWIKETFIRSNFADPNALICVLPIRLNQEGEDKILEPIPYIFDSKSVIQYEQDEYYLLFKDESKNNEGKKGYITWIDRERYVKMYLKADKIKVVFEYDHGFGEVPAFFSGGLVNLKDYTVNYESFVGGVQPHWDKVVEMTSDKDGVIVNHLYPERYEFQVECNTCNGQGYKTIQEGDLNINLPSGSQEPTRRTCKTCEGSGQITGRSPYGAYTVSLNALNPDAAIPTPPVEYITKDIAPLDALLAEIDKEKQNGFASINMEILNKVGENQSGIAKVIDRQDLDAFLMRISTHIFGYVLPELMKFTSYWMYSETLGMETIKEYLSEIQVNKPMEFNVLSVDALVQEYNNAKTVGANSNYLKNIESEIVNIKYSKNERERKKNLAIVTLKPFPDKTIDDLMTAKSIGSVREKDVILNENIDLIVDTALFQNDDFLELNQLEQLDVLYKIIEDDFLPKSVEVIPPSDE